MHKVSEDGVCVWDGFGWGWGGGNGVEAWLAMRGNWSPAKTSASIHWGEGLNEDQVQPMRVIKRGGKRWRAGGPTAEEEHEVEAKVAGSKPEAELILVDFFTLEIN